MEWGKYHMNSSKSDWIRALTQSLPVGPITQGMSRGSLRSLGSQGMSRGSLRSLGSQGMSRGSLRSLGSQGLHHFSDSCSTISLSLTALWPPCSCMLFLRQPRPLYLLTSPLGTFSPSRYHHGSLLFLLKCCSHANFSVTQ